MDQGIVEGQRVDRKLILKKIYNLHIPLKTLLLVKILLDFLLCNSIHNAGNS